MLDQPWSIEISPTYDDPEEFLWGGGMFSIGPPRLDHMRFSISKGNQEVFTLFKCIPSRDDDYMAAQIRAIEYGRHNPLQLLLDDAELGRKTRERVLSQHAPYDTVGIHRKDRT